MFGGQLLPHRVLRQLGGKQRVGMGFGSAVGHEEDRVAG
ncbi:hypothetical protein BLL52_0301 [Rhodoferax antarcticus ANT.BR]|uniref:Uncharacterized protein n=1 Tax=Rhodoferax antarcticus ANT.BR TaxID=1111071 RepID=A0A1Q8YL59_9BURK|nr:hypothetical protein BLL52_0301 [Rhodoferax antarcticus ANT.BR]